MKILIVFNRYEYRGGEDTYVENLTKLLRSKGHVVRLFVKDSRSITGLLSKIVTAFGMFYNPILQKELERVISEFKPEAAHFHNIYPLITPLAYKICKQNNVKIIQTIHNYKFICPKNDLYRGGKICELCTRSTLGLSPSVLFGCYHGSRLASLFYTLSYLFHTALGRYKLINTFIFPSQFTHIYYARHTSFPIYKFHYLPYHIYGGHKSTKGKDYLLYVGRLTDEKGILQLIQAIKNTDQQLYVVGDGPLRDQIKLLSSSFKNITYLGHKTHNQVLKLIAQAKALIVPSIWFEVLPNVILEANKMNKDVWVSSNNPNLKTLTSLSNYIHTYSDFKDLFSKLKRKWQNVKNNALQDSLAYQTSPEYHYKVLISLYKK